jgi:pimeloyl-ACP methyl ester carboxylesterase
MNNPKFRFALCSLILLTFLSACSGASERPTIQLTPCTVGTEQAQCGVLRVYENRAAGSGRMIDLKVVIIKARSATPAPDPIFYLAGGPGGAAASADATHQQFPRSLSENHDLVFVDQRGTGGSSEVLIPSDGPDLTGLTLEQIDAKVKPWVAKVLSEIDMDPRYYTTSVAMDDLDEVRAALGYDKINLVGYSYGAIAAQYYLRQHEDHVRSVVLGVGSLLDIPLNERWAQNSQRALDKTLDRCLADPACGKAFPNIRAELAGLMDRIQENPVTITQPINVIFDAEFLAGLIRSVMKDAQNTSTLPLFIHRAYQDNDWQGFTSLVVRGFGPEWWGNQFMDHVIRCSEKWAAFDPTVVAQLGKGSFFLSRDLPLAQSTALSCKYTPAGMTPEGQSPQPGSQVPVLIWNGEVDPLEPPANMAGAKTLWPNSLALVAPYQGHALSDRDAILNCFFPIMNDFIQSGSVASLDTTCLQNIKPPAFVVP